jgi:hypothetical protein
MAAFMGLEGFVGGCLPWVGVGPADFNPIDGCIVGPAVGVGDDGGRVSAVDVALTSGVLGRVGRDGAGHLGLGFLRSAGWDVDWGTGNIGSRLLLAGCVDSLHSGSDFWLIVERGLILSAEVGSILVAGSADCEIHLWAVSIPVHFCLCVVRLEADVVVLIGGFLNLLEVLELTLVLALDEF